VSGVSAAHAARLGWPTNTTAGLAVHGAIADDVVHLGLAKHFIDGHTQRLLAIVDCNLSAMKKTKATSHE
jgi:hypothetical protein